MKYLDEILGASKEDEPPMRDLDGIPVEVRTRQPLMLHQLTEAGANGEENPSAYLSAPEIPLLTQHDKFSLEHLIERYADFYNEKADLHDSVALPQTFVDHYMVYRDSTLPTVGAIVTAPLVLPNRTVLNKQGLDREHRLVFRVEPCMQCVIPNDWSPQAAAEALEFLVNEWLCDVATDFKGKCVLIASALSIIERVLLPERPAFFVTAGQRGGGKTTAISLIVLAVIGKKPPAGAWSMSEEERRKALFSYLMEGVPVLVWDNIPRGYQISCSSIERALTGAEYVDRVLGETKTGTAPATMIQFFTGNNIGPKGDQVSRSLTTRIEVARPDPENRQFEHTDPVDWTLRNRDRILRALYTILLSNDQFEHPKEPKTRFKMWWRLVGSAVESAARYLCRVEELNDVPKSERIAELIDFEKMFNEGEKEDEQTSGIATALTIMYRQFGDDPIKPSEVEKLINNPPFHPIHDWREEAAALRGAIEQATGKALPAVTSTYLGHRLKAMVGSPVLTDEGIMRLTRETGTEGRASGRYKVELTANPATAR